MTGAKKTKGQVQEQSLAFFKIFLLWAVLGVSLVYWTAFVWTFSGWAVAPTCLLLIGATVFCGAMSALNFGAAVYAVYQFDKEQETQRKFEEAAEQLREAMKAAQGVSEPTTEGPDDI